jgi:beta-lactamase superfamily II metal-dependent hydrolase
MRRKLGLMLLAATASLHAAKTLDVYFIDVEGGQATLLVTPSRQSMLVDAGWPGFSGRDADRIARVAKKAGVKAIDYLVTTHYHTDHVGGVPQLAAKMKIRNFVDHGPNNESGKNPDALYKAYEEAAAKGNRITVKPGDTIPLKGVEVRVVTANGQHTDGSGSANALCSSAKSYPEDKSENARSVGLLITFGKFRMINLGDLTSRKELELVCPENRIGPVDLYLTTHHGLHTSNAQEIVHALKPRVAIMNNGAKKGGSPEAWQIIRKSPGLEDLWQLHFAIAGKAENNSPESFIANLEESCAGQHLAVSVNADGSFVVTNPRNGYKKTYSAR